MANNSYKLEELLEFAVQGRYLSVQSLVNEGVDPNGKNSNNETPLMLAAEESHREVVELLIYSGADIHCCDNRGWTVLHYASYGGLAETIQYLVNKGLAFDVKGSYGVTPLMLAAGGVFELLIKLGADIHCCDDAGWTVLHHASCSGSVEKVQSLVNKGLALDVKESKGRTPLMMAALFSHREVVKVLINSGANIHCSDYSRRTALHYASIDINESDDVIPLIMTAMRSHREVVQMLVNAEGDIPCCQQNKFISMLDYAAEGGETADYLLNAGANCNVKDYNRESPFSLFIKKKRVQTIKLCIEKGTYVKVTENNMLLDDPLLKTGILQDVKLCSQALINKLNNRDLPLLYRGLSADQRLPHVSTMKIGNNSEIALQVEQAVLREIQANGFCNLFEIVPLVLNILCVKSAIENLRNQSEA